MPVYGSGAVVCSWSLLFAAIIAVVRQKLHLSSCTDFRGRLLYGLVKVRSPAPPAIALLGLLGMLVGEQAVTLVRSHVFKDSVQLSAAPHEAATSDPAE
jgi:XapX domain-containing protein